MHEQERQSDEADRQSRGAPARDISEYSEWRNDTDPEVQELLGLYGFYLVGQMAGMSEVLSLQAADVMFRYEGIPLRKRREMWPRLSRIHQIILGILRKREERKRKRDPNG